MSTSPKKPSISGMKLSMPQYTPELEYTIDLGAESSESRPITPVPQFREVTRKRNWRSSSHERDQTHGSSAYDKEGHWKVAERGRLEALRDCGICEEVATEPLVTDCCGALFCREHINDWLYGPASSPLCPSCQKTCMVPAIDSASSSSSLASHSADRNRTLSRSRSSSPPVTIESPATRRFARMEYDSIVRLISIAVSALLLLGVLSRRGLDGNTDGLATTYQSGDPSL
ncbi:unnamed protein product [Mycena citricolor]|uniref:RING-type domain-containing protein n=1 Tax=Mycena citricolor TaxID=2018698 RepID=A0AAD2GSM6_9AGAR|nr:unnamed protein product [Mycena citricolor]